MKSAILNNAVFFRGEKSVQRCGNETILRFYLQSVGDYPPFAGVVVAQYGHLNR